MSYIYIGATAAKIAFGRGNGPVIVKDWAAEYQRLIGERVAMAGQPNSMPQAPEPCGGVHKFEDRDFRQRCVFCDADGGVARGACAEGVERHHRSCALRLGGNSCTC